MTSSRSRIAREWCLRRFWSGYAYKRHALVSAAFLLAAVGKFLETLSGDPVIQGWVALIAAAVTAIFSQKPLALDPKYLVKAKKSPPLFGDREKTVWKKQQQSTES